MKRILFTIVCCFCIGPLSAQQSAVDSLWIARADAVRNCVIGKGLLQPDDEFCCYTMGNYKYVFLIRDADSFRQVVYWRDREPERRDLTRPERRSCRRLFRIAKRKPVFEYSDHRYETQIYYTMMYLGIFSDGRRIYEFVLPDHKLSKGKDGLKYPLPRDIMIFLGEKLLLEE